MSSFHHELASVTPFLPSVSRSPFPVFLHPVRRLFTSVTPLHLATLCQSFLLTSLQIHSSLSFCQPASLFILSVNSPFCLSFLLLPLHSVTPVLLSVSTLPTLSYYSLSFLSTFHPTPLIFLLITPCLQFHSFLIHRAAHMRVIIMGLVISGYCATVRIVSHDPLCQNSHRKL